MRDDWTRLILIGYVGVAMFCFLSCDSDNRIDAMNSVSETIEDPDLASVTSANTEFGFKLLQDLRKRKPNTNIFISPLSISIALTMTFNGSVGETARAMAEVLEIDMLDRNAVNRSNMRLRESLSSRGPKVEISIANSIWSRQDVELNPDFLEQNRQFFEAEIASLDFAASHATEIINEWVDTNTNGKIEKIVDEIDPLTLLLLMNAIYFKGNWQEEFDKSQTREEVFYLSDGSTKPVQMMHREGAYPYFRGTNFEAARLPYGDGDISMYIFLPNRNSSLNEFLDGLNAENWKNWLPQFSPVRIDSMMILPRFKLEYEVHLNEPLKALGMEIAFSGGADFSGMGHGLFISEVRHKTFIEVNEEGTEAAAVTVVALAESAPPVFRVDRPFFFTIYDAKTRTMLFIGIVTEPM